jgi:hypothetical protein
MLMGIFSSFFVIIILLLPLQSQAKIKDGIACSTCHTMHNSQDNVTLTGSFAEGLLKSSCIGCHLGDNPDLSGRMTPFVISDDAPEYSLTGTESGAETLAGGTFYWSYNGDENKGHNVWPGAEPTSTNPPGGDAMATQLTCAGNTGCHGDLAETNQYTAMRKSHHADDSTNDGSTIGKSYRFLDSITGLEDPDWELPDATPPLSETKHNQYKGSTDWDNNESNTITSFCAHCHGYFHGDGDIDTDGSSPWLRHPTDIPLPLDGEFASYTTYNPVVPVASTSTSSVISDTTNVTLNDRIVTCISCHRAHGSPWDNNLRWNYLDWPGTGGYDGCGICHSSKN